MREVTVDRFVAESTPVVERALTPARVVEYEGSFEVMDVDETTAGTVVSAGARGLALTLRFEAVENGLRYEQEGDAGPFQEMWTRLSWEPENEGTRVTARSGVSLGLPVAAITDRVAAWKRRGELKRALGNLAADVE